jgi:dipeptidyl aminopeptidase/acylaminoacyl peptidase
MRTFILLRTFILVFSCQSLQAQLAPLTVDKIMRDPAWIGTSPSSLQWSEDSRILYFNWNPENALADSLYQLDLQTGITSKLSPAAKQLRNAVGSFQYNQKRTAYVYAKQGDIIWEDVKTGRSRMITQTVEVESNPTFSCHDQCVVYNRNGNLYAWDIQTGTTQQLSNIGIPDAGRTNTPETGNLQDQWLKADQLAYFEVLKMRKEKRDAAALYQKNLPKRKEMRVLPLDDKLLFALQASPSARFISYRLGRRSAPGKSTIVPNYVTESGFTTDIPARTKVGFAGNGAEGYIYDRELDTLFAIPLKTLDGVFDIPAYVKDYPNAFAAAQKSQTMRTLSVTAIEWNEQADRALIDVRALDNKDRWILLFDGRQGRFQTIDRQHDDAWIAGPGIGGSFGGGAMGWIDSSSAWFQSEKTGYAHLYQYQVSGNQTTALTQGRYEVLRAQLSHDKKSFYITTNEIEPGQQHLYRLQLATGKKDQLTTGVGAHQVTISPDEKQLAILYSSSNQPWELFLQENKVGAKSKQITQLAASEAFRSYPWQKPSLVQIPARDGQSIWARQYVPAKPDPKKPAVIFVHGAGYLQNAHQWWSSYFREYMFHHLLMEQGYYVLDIDYRGSAGYGRDWRTGIYRHMGGKDLTDHVDAAQYLVKQFGVDPKRIGIYGGSYGGFITLMALFTQPGVFAAGAALRPVTDWAHYNHGYTSNILNEPFTDSLAYRRSSPIYLANGLQDALLICHGMVDVNVHFQDVVRLSQRLIELKKENWELAVYPVEDHGFVEPSSWADEYKRIFKLFEQHLKR